MQRYCHPQPGALSAQVPFAHFHGEQRVLSVSGDRDLREGPVTLLAKYVGPEEKAGVSGFEDTHVLQRDLEPIVELYCGGRQATGEFASCAVSEGKGLIKWGHLQAQFFAESRGYHTEICSCIEESPQAVPLESQVKILGARLSRDQVPLVQHRGNGLFR